MSERKTENKPQPIYSWQLSGSALFYALLVSILIAAFSSAMITGAYYHRIIRGYTDIELKLVQNAYSGIELLKAEKKDFPRQALDLFDTETDSVLVEKKQWGVFEIALAEAFQQTQKGRLSQRKIALLGSPAQQDWEQAAIYLRDGFKALTLAGQTRITGTVFLPKSGVKSGYVEGQSFSGDTLINGQRKVSTANMPTINVQMIAQQRQYFSQQKAISPYQLADSTQQSFFEPTILVRDSVIYVNEQELSGNICLFADSLVYLGRNTIVEDILIFAPNIYVEAGFAGNFQAFATNYLEIGHQARLTYPSVITLQQNNEIKTPAMGHFRSKAKMQGLFLVLDDKKGKTAPNIRIEKESLIEGQIYANTAFFDFQGNVHGNLTASGFRLRTPTSQYENHLWNDTIDVTQRPNFYLSPLLFNNPQKQIVQWLE